MSDESARGVSPGSAVGETPSLDSSSAPGPVCEVQVRERRSHPRLACEGGAKVCLPHGGLLLTGTILNVSLSGCYIEARSINLERGTQVEVSFETRQLHFRVAGNITVLHPRKGVGISFLKLSHRATRQITQLMQELADQAPPPSPEGETST